MYDLITGIETQITTNSGAQWRPKIYNNGIVWQDNRNGNWDIYGYDLAAGEEGQLTKDIGDQEMPVINNNKIIYQDLRNGNLDIYMTTLVCWF